MSFDASTQIALGYDEAIPIARLAVAEFVWGGTLNPDQAPVWTAQAVESNTATAPGVTTQMLSIRCAEQSLLVTPGQVFPVWPLGHLMAASALVPGTDRLYSLTGDPVTIIAIASGQTNFTVHSLATTTRGEGRAVDNHLIGANGIVAGDQTLEQQSTRKSRLP